MEPMFYGELVYQLYCSKIQKNKSLIIIMIIKLTIVRYKTIGLNIDYKQQTICLVGNPIIHI